MSCEYRIDTQAYISQSGEAARTKCVWDQTKYFITKEVSFQCQSCIFSLSLNPVPYSGKVYSRDFKSLSLYLNQGTNKHVWLMDSTNFSWEGEKNMSEPGDEWKWVGHIQFEYSLYYTNFFLGKKNHWNQKTHNSLQ